jgi:hypothetical protein
MKRILLLGALLCGCGDGDGTAADAGHDGDPGADDHARVFAVASNFAGAGVASTIGVPSLEVKVNVIDGVAGDDPYVRYIDGTIYIINSFGSDNITVIDPFGPFGPLGPVFVEQMSTGVGTSPQDVAVKGSTIYVAALSAPGVVVLDLDDPRAPPGIIDLSAFDENDGIPDCSSIYRVDDRLFVTCGLLQNFSPVGPGKVVVIDTTDNTVAGSFDLESANPLGFLQPTPADSALGGDLLIGTATFPELRVGCLERIGTGPTPASKGCLIDNAELGGYASSYAHGSDDTLYIAVTQGFDPGPISAVRRYDAASATLLPEPMTPPEQSIFDLVRCPTGELVMADAAASGVRVYTEAGNELTDEVLNIGALPVSKGLSCY